MTAEIQTIPYNQFAEQGVLGSLMICADESTRLDALKALKPESFYLVAHQLIFREMQNLARKNQPMDLLTLDNALQNAGVIEQVGGFAYLAEFAKNTPSSANLGTYVQIVRDEAIRRFTLAKLQECQALLLSNNGKSATERVEAITLHMSQIADHSRTGRTQGLRNANSVAKEWLSDYEARLNGDERVKGLSTGLPDLDALLGDGLLQRQSLAVVGARPKCGKTALYSAIAGSCVLDSRKTALLFSLEMSAKQIFERILTQRANVNTQNLYSKSTSDYLRDEAFAKVSNVLQEVIHNDLLMIDDTPNASMAHIRQECRRIKRERGEIGLIAVDYLTLMKTEAAERNDLAYGNITKDLKNLAREMDCVVLLLTQLNRGLESRADKRPMPSDSRDTGQIEQECDYWFGLYKESVYNDQADKTLTEILLRLNRHGKIGKCYVDQRFGSMFSCDQLQAEQRAQIGKSEPKNKRNTGEF